MFQPDMYEVFEHTADLGLRIRAADLETLFAEAGQALVSLIVDVASIEPRQEATFRIEGRERDYLLFDWLNELLFAFEKDRLLYCEFTVAFDAEGLSATARGEPLDPSRHELDHEVKAITYHGLKVRQEAGGWLAELIVDI
jgi:SHS2 domain-containing protein